MAFRFLILSVAISALVVFSPASAQITTPCTPSMITTFTPCVNFVSNSSLNGTAPPSDCCNSLRSLMSSGKDCLCLIATGSVPFRIPINQSVAMNLPRACNMPGVPLQCKAAGAPVPAPGPAAFGPAASPNAAPASPPAIAPTEAGSPTSTPEADAPPTTPAGSATPTTPANGGATTTPTSSTGSRAGVTPSAASPMHTISPLLFVAGIGAIALKYY